MRGQRTPGLIAAGIPCNMGFDNWRRLYLFDTTSASFDMVVLRTLVDTIDNAIGN